MKIFVLVSRFPYPLQKGDKLRAFNQIKELSKDNEIILCALNDTPIYPQAIKQLKPYCSAIEIIDLPKSRIYFNLIWQLLFSKTSLQVAYFYNQRAQRKINKLLEKYQPDHIYCQLIRVASYVMDSDIPKTLDYMDALARGMERRIERAPMYLKPFLKIETKRLKTFEHEVFDRFDYKTIISDQDRKLIVHIRNDEIEVIPNGVDFEQFYRIELPTRYDLVFTGNMSYPPNVMAAEFLVKEIMPLVWKEEPNINVALVGATPSNRVKVLARERVTVTGFVKDIKEYYSSARIFIAPMQIGTGLQNKLLEAMAIKLPCITSTLANNALGATHMENILIADEPREYASCILKLLEDKKLSTEIGAAGNVFVHNTFDWTATTRKLEALMQKGH